MSSGHGTVAPKASEAQGRPRPALAPHPALGGQLNLLEALFEHMPAGIAILDREYRLVRCNPAWAAFMGQYTPSRASQVVPGTCVFELQPGTEDPLIPLFERAFAGDTVRREAVRLATGGIVSYWDLVLSPLFEGEEIAALLYVSIDATARVPVHQDLEQRIEDRTRELNRRREISEGLRDTLRKINSSGSLDEVLDLVVSQADALGDTAFVALYVLQGPQGPLQIRALRGKFPEAMRTASLMPGEGIVGRAVAERCIVAIPNVDEASDASVSRETDEPEPACAHQIIEDPLQGAAGPSKALLAIPLLTQNAPYGALAFYYPRPHAFSEEEIALASIFAEQAALAIENALLRRQAAEVAKLAERDRLARDLHDAVSQTLFSASLIADVLPRLWERNPQAGEQKLDELRLLTRGALAEMRALLLELRSDAFDHVELSHLYRHLAHAFSGRTRIPVAFTLEGRADLPPEVKEAFYRVAQEALNNIAKHAGADQVQLHLRGDEDGVTVSIRDNGAGFDATALTPQNLGLAIMRERVEAIHGDLVIESACGAGTAIYVQWPGRQESTP